MSSSTRVQGVSHVAQEHRLSVNLNERGLRDPAKQKQVATSLRPRRGVTSTEVTSGGWLNVIYNFGVVTGDKHDELVEDLKAGMINTIDHKVNYAKASKTTALVDA